MQEGKGAPKTPAFKRIQGFRVICKFLEVKETSPPLCNMYFASKNPIVAERWYLTMKG